MLSLPYTLLTKLWELPRHNGSNYCFVSFGLLSSIQEIATEVHRGERSVLLFMAEPFQPHLSVY